MAFGKELIQVILSAQDNISPGVSSAEGSLDRLKSSASKLNSVLGSIGAGVSLGFLAKEFIDANSAMESMELALRQVTGSSAAASAEMEFLRGAASDLGIGIEDAARSYMTLAAAAKGTNMEGEATRQVWQSVTRAITALGGSSADVQNALIQLAQGVSKGKFELEDLKSVSERIPGFFNLASKSIGVTTGEFLEMQKNGEIIASEFLPKLARELNNTFGNERVDTFAANLSRLKNSLTEVFLEIGQGGAFDAFTGVLKGASVAVGVLWEGVELLGKSLGNLAYTVTSLDFAGYKERQKANLDAARADVANYIEKVYGIGTAMKKAESESVAATSSMAESIKVVELTTKEVEKRMKELEKVLTPVQQAYQDIGLVSTEALKQTAAAAKAAYETLAANKAPIADLKLAWIEYAQSAMDAAVRAGEGQANVTRATLEAEAAAKGYIVTISENGEVVSQTLTQWAQKYDELAAAQARAGRAAQDAAVEFAQASVDMREATGEGIGSLQTSIDWFFEHLKGLGESMTGVINGHRRALREMTDDSRRAMEEFEHAITAPVSSIDAWLRRMNDARERITDNFETQARSVDRFIERLNAGNASLDNAVFLTDKLDDQRLENLRAAIEDARRRMADFANQSRDTVASLRSELAGLKGDYEQVARLQGEQKIAELREKLSEATRTNNKEAVAELQRAIELQKEINRLRLEEARERERDNRSGTQTSGGGSSSGGRQGGGISGGITVNVQGDVLDPDALARKLSPSLEKLDRYRR